MNILICPVCKNELFFENKTAKCENNHCFDLAKEGYVNLLSAFSGDIWALVVIIIKRLLNFV